TELCQKLVRGQKETIAEHLSAQVNKFRRISLFLQHSPPNRSPSQNRREPAQQTQFVWTPSPCRVGLIRVALYSQTYVLHHPECDIPARHSHQALGRRLAFERVPQQKSWTAVGMQLSA